MAYPIEAKPRKPGSLSISAVTIYDELHRKINKIAILVDLIVFSINKITSKALWYGESFTIFFKRIFMWFISTFRKILQQTFLKFLICFPKV